MIVMIFVYAKSLDKKDDKITVSDSTFSTEVQLPYQNKILYRNFIKTINCILSIKDLACKTGLNDYSINVLEKMFNDHPLGIGGSNLPLNHLNIPQDDKELNIEKISSKVNNIHQVKKVSKSVKKKKKSVTLTNIAVKRINQDISNDSTIIFKSYTRKMLQKLPFKVKIQISNLIRDISLIEKIEILSKQKTNSQEIIFVRIFYKNQSKKSFYLFETQHGKFFFNKNGKTVERILKYKETLQKFIISSGFGVRWFKGRYGFHGGLDLHSSYGTDIHSLEAGVVIKSERRHDYGNYVVVQHRASDPRKTTYTLYAHMSKRLVKVGDKIKKGQKLGEIGSTGWSTGPHLHLEFMNSVKSKKNPAIDINFGQYILLNKDLSKFNKTVSEINNIYQLKTNQTISNKVSVAKSGVKSVKKTSLPTKQKVKEIIKKDDIKISNKSVIRSALNKSRKSKTISSN